MMSGIFCLVIMHFPCPSQISSASKGPSDIFMDRLREYRFCNINSFSRPRRAHRWSSKDMRSFSPQKSVPSIDLIKGWLLIQYIMEGIIHPRSNSRASWRAAKGVLLTGGMVRVLLRWCHASRVVGKVAARCCRARRRRYWTSYFVLKRSTPATMRNSVWEGGGSKYLGRVRDQYQLWNGCLNLAYSELNIAFKKKCTSFVES